MKTVLVELKDLSLIIYNLLSNICFVCKIFGPYQAWDEFLHCLVLFSAVVVDPSALLLPVCLSINFDEYSKLQFKYRIRILNLAFFHRL